MAMSSNQATSDREQRRYLRAPVPLVFPTDEEMPEHKTHVLLRTALFQLLALARGDRVIVGSEQFVYFDAANPNRRLAPDLMVWVGAPDEIFGAWKVWERGAPHVCVEIVSPSDRPPGPWHKKVERYQQCGVQELVRFDPESETAKLRIWDRIEGDLVERDLSSSGALRCDALDLWWHVVSDSRLGPMLRLATDEAGLDLLPTPEELVAREAEARERETDARAREADGRKIAEARVRELEQEIERLRNDGRR